MEVTNKMLRKRESYRLTVNPWFFFLQGSKLIWTNNKLRYRKIGLLFRIVVRLTMLVSRMRLEFRWEHFNFHYSVHCCSECFLLPPPPSTAIYIFNCETINNIYIILMRYTPLDGAKVSWIIGLNKSLSSTGEIFE